MQSPFGVSVKSILTLHASTADHDLLNSVLGDLYVIEDVDSVNDVLAILEHSQPDIVLIGQPYTMDMVQRIITRAARTPVMVLTGPEAWAAAIREIMVSTVTRNNQTPDAISC